MAIIRQPLTGAKTRESPKASARFDWIAILLSAWWVGGIFLDGWAHSHLPQLETFFTPWHAVLYSGFLVVAMFLLATAVRNHAQGYSWEHVMPRGYELSLLGVGVFAVGGILDLLWHLFFGIERGMAALLSPTHLILALGTVLAVSGPLRAAWQRPVARRQETLFKLLPSILSLTYVLAGFTFFTLFTQYANPIIHPQADKQTDSVELWLVSILLQTAVFMGVALFALSRWQLPLGTFAILYLLNNTLAITQSDISHILVVALFSLLTGALVDLLYKALKPTVE